jgi:putative sterol carrier protein
MSDAGVPDIGREGLSQLLEGRSDEEINEFAAQAGVDTLLAQIFEGMRAAFVPERAAGQSAVAQWDVTAPDGTHTFQVKMADGECTVGPGTGESARVTLGLTLPDFLRFVSGQLDGMQAFMSGKLKLSGDMMFATTMQNWFDA